MELKGLLLVCISLCCCSPANLSRISIAVDGGYGNIVVKISSLLSDKSCGTILRNVQELFKKSSGILNSSLSGRGYFREVVVVIPSSWDSSLCGFTLESLSAGTAYRNADVMIEEEDPVHGHSPFTQQSRGCGESGDKIYLPTSFIKEIDNTTVAATQFVEQWIKYRYGVFEATGYPGDKLYPDDLGEDVNKHNVICGGRSVQNIISSHADFLIVKTDNEPERDISPIVRIVQEPSVKYILAIETTSSMSVGDHWKWVNKAAQKLIRLDLPLNKSMAVMTFNNGSKIVHPMIKVVGEKERAKLADTIPGKYHLADNNVRCVACVLDMAVNQVMKEDTAGAHIVLITRGSSDSLSLTDERIIAEYVNNYDIKVSSIIIPTVNHLSFYDQISKVSGGHSFLIRDSGFSMDAYVSVVEAFQSILNEEEVKRKVETIHRNEYITGEEDVTSGSFTIDHSIEKNPSLGIYVEDEEDHLIRSIKLENEEGVVYGPYTKMSSTFDLINYKTVNFVGESPLHRKDVSKWNYTINWYPHVGPIRKSLIRVNSIQNMFIEDIISVKVWTNESPMEELKPIGIFAQVKKGNSPVINARVVLDIEVENENGSILLLPLVALGDDGLGEPDMKQGDGIYSSFLTEYSLTGRYSLNVKVDDNNGAAYSVLQRQDGHPIECCGSFVDIPESRKVPTRAFQRISSSLITHLSKLPEKDIIPPAKVADLEIILDKDNTSLVASWSGVGGDYQDGHAARYKFVYSANVSDLIDPSRENKVLAVVDRSDPSGSQISERLEFPLYDETYYVGLYSFDSSGNRGRLSNLVDVYIPAPEPVITTTPTPLLSILKDSSSDLLLVVAISVTLGVLLLFCTVAIILYCITGSRKRPSSPSPSSDKIVSDQTDSSSCNSERNSSSQIDVKDLEKQITDPKQVIDQHRITPVYWSASQILSKIESPLSSYSYQGQPLNTPSNTPSITTGNYNESFLHIHRNPSLNRTLEQEYMTMRTPNQEHRHQPTAALNRATEQDYVERLESQDQRIKSYGILNRTMDNEYIQTTPSQTHRTQTAFLNRTMEDTYLGYGVPEYRRQVHSPEDYCVTVGSVSDSGSETHKQPPPLMPKPRNITEV